MRRKRRVILDAVFEGHPLKTKGPPVEEELMSYQLVGEVTAHQGEDG
jgi:hypothetical protein